MADLIFKESLSSIACYSAVELDNIILKRSEKREELGDLLERLKKHMPVGQTEKEIFASYDPCMTVLLWNAMKDTYGKDKVSTKTIEVIGQARKVIEKLEQAYDGNLKDQDTLEEMRSFCLALSRNAVARESQSYRPHPYKKYIA